jgi:hypothetical protein
MELPTMRFVPLVIAAVVLNILFYFFCLNHIGPASVGIAYNALNGEVTSQKHAGWYITSPFVRVASIDTRPTQVCLNAGTRILSCKLIEFVPEGAEEFVKLQGFRYYDGAVVNNSCHDCNSDMYHILQGYAFSGREYPFLRVIEELK